MFFPTPKQRKDLERIEKFLMASHRRDAIAQQELLIKNFKRKMQRWVYTAGQAGSLLNLSPKTLRQYIRQGKLGAARVGRQYLLTSRDIKSFLDNHRLRVKNKKAEP